MLVEISAFMDRFVPELITLTKDYYDDEDYLFAQDKWMDDVAFPQFRTIFENYDDCSVDMVFFDEDLDDFKGSLALVRKQQGRYYDEMDALIDGYTDLNERLEDFFEAIDNFDQTLWTPTPLRVKQQ